MKEIKKLMIRQFDIKNLDCDMMGYFKQKGDDYQAHHLLIPKCNGGKLTRDNTAILYTTSHEYLHVIQRYDEEIFYAITSEMIDQLIKGRLDSDNLYYIDDCLNVFEREHCSTQTNRGKPLIKEKYLQRNKFVLY